MSRCRSEEAHEACRGRRGERRHRHLGALAAVFGLTAAFTVVELAGGILTGSLALIADSGHLLSDALSIGLALLALWIAGRPPTPERSFGYRRAEILAALFNGITLVAISIWIFIEAYGRLMDPPEILSGWMLAIAVAGLGVNVAALWLLRHDHGESLNIAAAFRHVLGDLLGSVGAIAAAVIILLTGWRLADPLIGIFIGLLVLWSSWSILRDSVHILLEGTPRGLDAREIHRRMAAQDGIEEVRDLHIWTITSGFPALTAHVLVKTGEDLRGRRRALERLLEVQYGIEHTTLQVDHAG
jgi:cobalt-zinc-cadmium efflux system protein